jgi:hypothetical protein
MPTVLRVSGYNFSFFAADGSERPHVHVIKGGGNAKFWIQPIGLARSKGFSPHQLRLIGRIVAEKQTTLLESWNEFFGQ